MRVIFRGFLNKRVVFTEWKRVTLDDDQTVQDLAEEHTAAMLAGKLDMVEIEFPDDPGPDRFFRIGVNPEGMVMPMLIKPEDLE